MIPCPVLAIDPSINNCGVAITWSQTCSWCYYDLITTAPGDDLLRSFNIAQNISLWVQDHFPAGFRGPGGFPKWDFLTVVIEVTEPRGYAEQITRQAGVYKLITVTSAIFSRFRELGATVIPYPVRKWKGQVPKHIIRQRLIKIYNWDIEEIKDDNIVDAIGILTHYAMYNKLKESIPL